MNREYHKWWSPNLQRDMELLVFGSGGAKVLVFPTRGGRFFEYENLGMVEKIRHKIEANQLQLFCIDGIDAESFYCYWAHPSGRMTRYMQYEEYVLREVLPLMHTINAHPTTISHGCSLGAFHAANIAFKHPHLFNKLCAFSGRYDLTLQVEYFPNLLDGHYDESVYFNTPTHFLPNLHGHDQLNALRAMDIVLVIGKEDPFLDNNLHLSQILNEKGIDHQLHLWEERAHRGYYWRRMVPLYL
ncbi:esterase family protein [Marinomonas balearica]|uniref:Esterase/lipase superfamily enzyme n=1 Tax=Marinomonas balearica TaxID=491947 RepID=A0A4R6MH36_9GAMM|nr:alpha/beta hydrolase-fold protein [Marinomonas balearica]TDP01242.1 esterase/lipase superfamily enzyme [Marinomonas balearica]